MMRTKLTGGRVAGTGMREDRYDDNYNPSLKDKTIKRGVNGVILPNSLSKEDYEEYVKRQSGEVRTYRLSEKGKQDE